MKINVGVIFGGESVEHEVGIITAVQAMEFMDTDKYEIIPIYISKERNWYTGECLKKMNTFRKIEILQKKATPINLEKVGNEICLMSKSLMRKKLKTIDIAFPIMHGRNGEDGSIQGYLEMLGVPYVGCNVYAAAVGQDKVFMKQILEQEGIETTNYTWFFDKDYYENKKQILEKVNKLNYPLIVKPARLGSSVGINMAKTKADIEEAVEDALNYDYKIIVEEVVQNLVELNVSVLGNYEEMQLSEIEEVAGEDEFLSYNDKYMAETGKTKGMLNTSRVIPARITKKEREEIQKQALKTFKVLNASGTSRIDFLMDKKNKKIYVNEINTIPGCLSFYLWDPAGKKYTQLLTEMIEVGIKNYSRREKMTFSFDSNILSTFNGSKGSKGTKAKI